MSPTGSDADGIFAATITHLALLGNRESRTARSERAIKDLPRCGPNAAFGATKPPGAEIASCAGSRVRQTAIEIELPPVVRVRHSCRWG
jgi:hypothetical protein